MKEIKTKNLLKMLKSLNNLEAAKPDIGFENRLRAKILEEPMEKSWYKGIFYFRKPFEFAIALSLLFIIVGGGMVFASQKALPGQALYPVKRASEQALLLVVPAPYKPQVKEFIQERRQQEEKELEKKEENDSHKKEVSKPTPEQKKNTKINQKNLPEEKKKDKNKIIQNVVEEEEKVLEVAEEKVLGESLEKIKNNDNKNLEVEGENKDNPEIKAKNLIQPINNLLKDILN